MKNKSIVIYHDYGSRRCADGFTAAWVASRRLGTSTTVFHPSQYGDPPPNVKGLDVYILDFSYPRDTLLTMKKKAKSIVVFDHHKTAREALEGLDFCTFDMTMSGAAMAFQHFFEGCLVPPLVRYTEDRDLWTWKLPYSKEINAYINTVPNTFQYWTELNEGLENNLYLFAQFGRTALRVTEKYVEEARSNAYLVHFEGFDEVPMVNTTFATSELVGELAEGKEFAIGWYRDPKSYVYSLRSRGDVDVSKLARRQEWRGKKGGGHVKSAGFRLDHLLS